MIEDIHPVKKNSEEARVESSKSIEEQILEMDNYIKAVCYRMLKDKHMTDELANVALYKAYRSVDKYDENKSSLRTWITTIAKNTVIDYIRKINKDPNEKWSENIDDHIYVPDKKPSPEQMLIDEEESSLRVEFLKQALEKLSEEHRQVLQMDFDELTTKEMSKKLGIPEITVRTRLFHARRKIANLLGQSKNFKVKRSNK